MMSPIDPAFRPGAPSPDDIEALYAIISRINGQIRFYEEAAGGWSLFGDGWQYGITLKLRLRELNAKLDRLLASPRQAQIEGDLVAETLDKIPKTTQGAKLVKFLASCPGRTATVSKVCKHLYKTTSKLCMDNTHALIRRNKESLESQNAPLRLSKEGINVSLIECQSDA
jgi:hypothetical protein